jgi:hypothetical protein
MQGRVSKPVLNVLQEEILEMFSQSAKVFQNCELIMVPVTGYITNSEGES